MHISNFLLVFSAALLASATPIPVRSSDDGPGSYTHFIKEFIHPLDLQSITEKHNTYLNRSKTIADIHTSCNANKDGILSGVAYAQTYADIAQGISTDDAAFHLFFLPEDHVPVQNMLKAIATSTGSKRFTIECPAEGMFDFKGRLALTDPAGKIRLSPALLKGAALFGKAQLGSTLSYFIIQEFTRLNSYASAAGWNETYFCDGVVIIGTCHTAQMTYLPVLDTAMADFNYCACQKNRWISYREKPFNKPFLPTLKIPQAYAALASFHSVERLVIAQPNGPKTIAMVGSHFYSQAQKPECN